MIEKWLKAEEPLLWSGFGILQADPDERLQVVPVVMSEVSLLGWLNPGDASPAAQRLLPSAALCFRLKSLIDEAGGRCGVLSSFQCRHSFLAFPSMQNSVVFFRTVTAFTLGVESVCISEVTIGPISVDESG